MTVTVRALERGGLAAFGRSSFDARLGAVIVRAEPGQTVPCRVSFPLAINSVNYDARSIETTEPVLDGGAMVFTLSNFREASRIRFDVMLANDEVRDVHFVIAGSAASAFPSHSSDYGTI